MLVVVYRVSQLAAGATEVVISPDLSLSTYSFGVEGEGPLFTILL